MDNFIKDNSLKFEEYRNKYKEFYFNSYSVKQNSEAIYLQYEFEIPNLTKFNPQIKILIATMQKI